jgi:hypothetical protein
MPDEVAAMRLKNIRSSTIDWKLLVSAATVNGLIPLLSANLKRFCPESVPPEIVESLKIDFVKHSRLSLKMLDELTQLLADLRSRGVVAVPFKGPHLAEKYYRDLLFRTFNDLDLWVSESDVKPTQQCLEERGYRRSDVRETQVEERILGSKLFRKLHFEYTYEKGEKSERCYIDLHWRVLPPEILPISDAELLTHVRQEMLWGSEIYSFTDEMTLLVVCLHACKHGWPQVSMIVDVAQIMMHSRLDWNALFAFAQTIGGEDMLLSGIFLAHELLRVDLPPEPAQRLKHSRVSVICGEIVERIHTYPNAPPWGEVNVLIFMTRLKSRWINRLNFLVQTCAHIVPRTLRRCFGWHEHH